MKVTVNEDGTYTLESETNEESMCCAVIHELMWNLIGTEKCVGEGITNEHGCQRIGEGHFNWCTVPGPDYIEIPDE